jgi:hypothetical protein
MKRVFNTFEEARTYLKSAGCGEYVCTLNLYVSLYLKVRNGDTAHVYCSVYSCVTNKRTVTGGNPQEIKFNKNGDTYVTYCGRRIYLDRFFYIGGRRQ